MKLPAPVFIALVKLHRWASQAPRERTLTRANITHYSSEEVPSK